MRKSVWIFVVAVTLLSCRGNDEIEKQIAVFREETVVLPELVKVEHREITRGDEIAGQEMWCSSTLKAA